ncbi:MAG: acyl-CoA desaturase [Bacteroidota bacterium]|jgi:stearoyl-CoA desaturase (delta-9 desaturase)
MNLILSFFILHWFLSLFFHTFFLHRFASHKMYETSKNWERFFYLCTWLFQGSSFLVPRAYGVMHRMHHAYSDTEKDPHSPHFFKDIYDMLKNTVIIYRSFLLNKNIPNEEFTKDYLPVWNKLDRFGHHTITRLSFIVIYTLIYWFFAPSFWWFLLLPIHFLMGPIQGAIVNWCGHKYGYRNFNSDDHSKNTGPFGFILLGELFQNNHHHSKSDANFAKKWFEFDLTYQIMRVFDFAGIIRLNKVSQSIIN